MMFKPGLRSRKFPSVLLLAGTAFISQSIVLGGVISASKEKPAFYADFNDSVIASSDQAAKIEPEIARGLKYVDGVLGQAVYVGGNGEQDWNTAPVLQYPGSSLFNSSASTIMFWVQPNWDGFTVRSDILSYRFLQAGQSIDLFMYAWLRADFQIGDNPRSDGQKGTMLSLANSSRDTWLRGDWWHLALSWGDNGWVKMYVNGMPYSTGFGFRAGPQAARQILGFTDTRSFAVGSSLSDSPMRNMRADAAFDELKIYNSALSDSEIAGEYRKVVPIDLIMERRYLRADQEEKLDLYIAPGGLMGRPQVDAVVKTPVEVKLKMTVVREDNNAVIAEQESASEISEQKTISIPLHNLTEGAYRLVVKGENGAARYQSSFRFYAYKGQAAAPASADDLTLGEPILTIDMSQKDLKFLSSGETTLVTDSPLGPYREAAPVKESRFSYELDLSKLGAYIGQPLMLEVHWPDDKPRSMGLYLYRKSTIEQQRDRLEGGIQSGVEYAESGQTQVTRYLFYPWVSHYLFEARTMVKDYPAAVSKIVVRPVIGRLPKLKVEMPVGLPSRSFGHLDEDQSFDALLAFDMPGQPEKKVLKNMEMLMDYLDYTGQNLFSFAFMRYGDINYEMPGSVSGYGGYVVGNLGSRDLLLDLLESRGKKCMAVINAYSLPENNKLPYAESALIEDNYFQKDRNGKVFRTRVGDLLGNPLHPKYQERLLIHFDELLLRYGKHPALAGFDLWTGDWQLQDTNVGYDDLTISFFEKETGLKVPGGAGDDRFSVRYTWLMHEHKAEWMAWRARKNVELIQKIAAKIQAFNPALVLNIQIAGEPVNSSREYLFAEKTDLSKFLYETGGMDLDKIREIPGVQLAVSRGSTYFRWQMHWNNTFSLADEFKADMNLQGGLRGDQPVQVNIYPSYFESFVKSLDNENYNCMFENADVKPHGRYFLQELSEAMTSLDPSRILIGAQPLGTSGRDAESREFAQAFLALPAVPFRDIEGLKDPVCGRYYPSENGTYLYLQNMVDSDVTVELTGVTDGTWKNLNTGEVLATKDQKLSITLKPFELRSFQSLAKVDGFESTRTVVPEQFSNRMQALYEKDSSVLQLLMGYGAETGIYEKRMAEFRSALDQKRYAEAHRIAFSKLLREMPQLVESAKQGYLKQQKEMIAAGRYAVSCGSKTFHVTSDGALFFPDQAYTPGGFGYIGSHNAADHSIEQLNTTVDKSILFSEAYDVESYGFTVPNGIYRVKLYNRIGFGPDAAPGKCVMSLNVQGKQVWDRMDLFTALKGDATQVLVSEFKDVVVTDGVLRIDWTPVDNHLGWCNAIEVIPEKTN